MLTSFCTILGYAIVGGAVMAVGVFVIAALIVGSIEIFSKKQ